MFGKKKNEDDSEKLMKVSADNLTMITIGTIVKGTITIAGGLHLEGTLEGDIICKGKVVIGPQGKVKGNVTPRCCMVCCKEMFVRRMNCT